MEEELGFRTKDNWSVYDFQEFLHQLNILYNRLYVVSNLTPGTNAKLSNLLVSSRSQVPDDEQLTISGIEIHSPGAFSFRGIGGIVKQVRGAIKDSSYRNALERSEREVALEHQQEMNQIEQAQARTSLMRQQIALMREAGIPEDEIQKAVLRIMEPAEKVVGLMNKRGVELIEND